ncbi:MAG: hypothetical protein R3C97_17485 [Geminicoccaceae bacterium]
MNRLFGFFFLLVMLAPPSSLLAGDRDAERNALFTALRQADGELDARRIENEIWQFWMVGPSEDATSRMEEGMRLRRASDLDGALAIAEALTKDYPQFAEAWNQKATLLFLMQRYDASLVAIIRVLELEPKHFGALSGRAIILMGQGAMIWGRSHCARPLPSTPICASAHCCRKSPANPFDVLSTVFRGRGYPRS